MIRSIINCINEEKLFKNLKTFHYKTNKHEKDGLHYEGTSGYTKVEFVLGKLPSHWSRKEKGGSKNFVNTV